MKLNVCQHFMNDETGQYVGILRFVPEDAALLLFKTLRDIEMLAQVNEPITDGSPMHLQIQKVLRKVSER